MTDDLSREKTSAEIEKLRREATKLDSEAAKLDRDVKNAADVLRLERFKAFGPVLTAIALLLAAVVAFAGQQQLLRSQQRTTEWQLAAQQRSTEQQLAAQQKTTEQQLAAQQRTTEQQLASQLAIAKEQLLAQEKLLELQRQDAKRRDLEQAYLALTKQFAEGDAHRLAAISGLEPFLADSDSSMRARVASLLTTAIDVDASPAVAALASSALIRYASRESVVAVHRQNLALDRQLTDELQTDRDRKNPRTVALAKAQAWNSETLVGVLQTIQTRHGAVEDFDLSGVTFAPMRPLSSWRPTTVLTNVVFKSSNLNGASFANTSCRGCQFIDTRLDGGELTQAQFVNCLFSGRSSMAQMRVDAPLEQRRNTGRQVYVSFSKCNISLEEFSVRPMVIMRGHDGDAIFAFSDSSWDIVRFALLSKAAFSLIGDTGPISRHTALRRGRGKLEAIYIK